jgi:hypothetical protein
MMLPGTIGAIESDELRGGAMWGKTRWYWVILLLWGAALTVACSAQRHKPQHEDLRVDGRDPFDDPFFTQSPEWDESVLQHSEVLAQQPREREVPRSFTERTQEVIFSTFLIGASLGQVALPLLGLGF